MREIIVSIEIFPVTAETWIHTILIGYYLESITPQLTQVAETFDVEEKPLSHAEEGHSNVTVIHAAVDRLDSNNKVKVLQT